MRSLWRLTGLAAGMILLLAMIQWVRSGADAEKADWLFSDRVDWLGLIDQLVAGFAVALVLACGKRQRGRTLGLIPAVGLVVTAVVGMAGLTTNGYQGANAAVLAFCLSLGLVVVLAGIRRWKLLWLGVAALLGTLPQAIELLSAAGSFTRQ